MIRVARLAVVLVIATLGACGAPAAKPSVLGRPYGQGLPDAFCTTVDFDPIVKALDVGPVFSSPGFLDHSGIENRWYGCDLSTMRIDGPNQYRHARAAIRIELFGQAASAAEAFDAALRDLTRPADFSADSVQRAVKDVRPDGATILILDGNLMLTTTAGVDEDLTLAPAVEATLGELALATLAQVRKSATLALRERTS